MLVVWVVGMGGIFMFFSMLVKYVNWFDSLVFGMFEGLWFYVYCGVKGLEIYFIFV